MGFLRGQLRRAMAAWLEARESMAAVEVSHLSRPGFVRRVRVPSVVGLPGPTLQYMGRSCFADVVKLVQRLSPGQWGCIAGPRGSGKSFLLATLAALLVTQPDLVGTGGQNVAIVYIDGAMFVETPLDILLLSLCVALSNNKTAVEELANIESWEGAVKWLKQRHEALYFLIDGADAFSQDRDAMACLYTVTQGAVVVYAAVAPLCLRLSAGSLPSVLYVGGLHFSEMSTFLKSWGRHLEEIEYWWHCTGGLPLLLEQSRDGKLNKSLMLYYYDLLDDYLQKPQEWRLVFDALAGGKLGQYCEKAVLDLVGNSGGMLFRNKDRLGDCPCDALRVHASLRAMQCTSLDMEQVLQAWVAPLLAGPAMDRVDWYSWNCLMAVLAVLMLRKFVHLHAVGESMLFDNMKLEAPSWLVPYFPGEMLVDSAPMAWPVITVTMERKAFVLCLDRDFDVNLEAKAGLHKRMTKGLCDDFWTYFVWIGCFGHGLEFPGVVCKYSDHTDLFINYGFLDPLLSCLDNVFPVARTRCRYFPVGRRHPCKLHSQPGKVLCHLHNILDVSLNCSRTSL